MNLKTIGKLFGIGVTLAFLALAAIEGDSGPSDASASWYFSGPVYPSACSTAPATQKTCYGTSRTVIYVTASDPDGVASCTFDIGPYSQVPCNNGISISWPYSSGKGSWGFEVQAIVVDKKRNTQTIALGTFELDNWAPSETATYNPPPNSYGWWNATNTPVTVSFVCDDGELGVGVAECPDPVTAEAEQGIWDFRGTTRDLLGNSWTGIIARVKIEITPPQIDMVRDPLPNAFGWSNTDVTLYFRCWGAISGILDCAGQGPVGNTYTWISNEGVNVLPQALPSGFTLTVTSIAGNMNTVTPPPPPVMIDKTLPNITYQLTKADGTPYKPDMWSNRSVTVTFNCFDPPNASNNTLGSGIASCGRNQNQLNSSITLSQEGKNQYAWAVAVDRAGNTKKATVKNINIDLTPPQVKVVLEGKRVEGGYISPVTVRVDCNDALSGVDASELKINGNPTPSPATLTKPGTYTVVAKCVDRAGNEARSKSVTVNVVSPPSLRVPQDVSSVQEAINKVADGGTVELAPGTYNERVQINNKSVVLRGAGREQTILDGTGLGPAKGVTIGGSAQVMIEGLTIRNFANDGVNISDSARVTIQGCLIIGNGDDGLDVSGSARVTIKESTIENNGTNCAQDWICNGIAVRGQSQTTIIDSIIRNNTDWGVGAVLKKCGDSVDDFTGKVDLQGTNVIEGNNTSANQNGKGNPGNHPFKNLPDGQVCLP